MAHQQQYPQQYAAPQYAQPVYRPQPPVSGWAVASLICALLWGFGFLSLLAVIFAVVGFRETSKGKRGSGMVATGLVLGIIGCISLVAFTFPLIGGIAGAAGA